MDVIPVFPVFKRILYRLPPPPKPPPPPLPPHPPPPPLLPQPRELEEREPHPPPEPSEWLPHPLNADELSLWDCAPEYPLLLPPQPCAASELEPPAFCQPLPVFL